MRQLKEFFDASPWNTGKKADILVCHRVRPRTCFDRPILFVEDDDQHHDDHSVNSLQRRLGRAKRYFRRAPRRPRLTYVASTRYVPSYGIMSTAVLLLRRTQSDAPHPGGPP